MPDHNWHPIQSMHCPVCGRLLRGCYRKDMRAKIHCRICNVDIISEQMGRRHIHSDIYFCDAQRR